jgi:putative protease
MELVAPAGNLEKLKYAYLFGADAVYIGIKNFSLRARADNFSGDEYRTIKTLKGTRKLYGALNIFYHDKDIKRLEEELDYIAEYPFDAFIIADMGIAALLKKRFPHVALHLSTQANCVNARTARIYQDLGFTRIIPGRELSLDEIATLKAQTDLEIEVFVHGAMCVAYSGRCLLSRYMTGRSANAGDCAHSCRWQYQLLEEERPGEYFPVIEGENFTTILSSRDLCMIDHLQELKAAGVAALKIEGRMKSIYYTAITTRAYRKALEQLHGHSVPELDAYKAELGNVSHREFSTGFFFGRDEIEKPSRLSYLRNYIFMGTLGAEVRPNTYVLNLMNQLRTGEAIEYVGWDAPASTDNAFKVLDENFEPVTVMNHAHTAYLIPSVPVQAGYLIRKKIPGKVE